MKAHEILYDAVSYAKSPAKQYKSQKTSWQQLAEALPRLATAISQFNKGARIYRGLNRLEPILFKPEMPRGTRSSANTQNYYTLFVDNSAAWAQFPPRSSGVICSTVYSKADLYGRVYVVLPEGNPVIGIAPQDDFWASFEKRLNHIGNLKDLNDGIKEIAKEWLQIKNFQPTSWPELQQVLQAIDDKNYFSFPNLPKIPLKNDWAEPLLQQRPGTTMEQKLSWWLDPKANGFKTVPLSNFKVKGDHEIWFSAPCWFIDVDILSKHKKTPLADLIIQIANTNRERGYKD